MQAQSNDEPVDGNAMGGFLSELFAFDITTASILCEGCDTEGDLAEMRVYGGAMGAMFRCARCDTAVMRLVHTPQGYFLDMRGTRRFFVRPPA